MISSIFFFFSSRRRHTRSLRDWSSDVCSSDLRSPCQRHRTVMPQPAAGQATVAVRRRPSATVCAWAPQRWQEPTTTRSWTVFWVRVAVLGELVVPVGDLPWLNLARDAMPEGGLDDLLDEQVAMVDGDLGRQVAFARRLLPDREVAVQQLGHRLAVDPGRHLLALSLTPGQQFVALGDGVVEGAAHANALLDTPALAVTAQIHRHAPDVDAVLVGALV